VALVEVIKLLVERLLRFTLYLCNNHCPSSTLTHQQL